VTGRPACRARHRACRSAPVSARGPCGGRPRGMLLVFRHVTEIGSAGDLRPPSENHISA
jgi:hypothetical protein